MGINIMAIIPNEKNRTDIGQQGLSDEYPTVAFKWRVPMIPAGTNEIEQSIVQRDVYSPHSAL